MDIDSMKERHAVLKRKANESVAELLGIVGQSVTAKRKSQIQKIWDVEAYKNIIKTYKSPVWSGCAVSPRDLADFGWACVKKNVVKCVECEEVLSTALPNISQVSINVYNSSLKHIHEKMSNAHRPTCRQKAGAPPFRIVDPSSKEIMEGIEERLGGASSFSEDDMIVEVPKEVSLPKLEKHQSNFVFVAALGWKITKAKRGYISLVCDHCARDLVLKCGSKFDPIHNHERWCPRIDKNDNGESYWQSDLHILLNTKNKIGPSAELLQNAGNIFKEVLSTRRILSSAAGGSAGSSLSSVIPLNQ